MQQRLHARHTFGQHELHLGLMRKRKHPSILCVSKASIFFLISKGVAGSASYINTSFSDISICWLQRNGGSKKNLKNAIALSMLAAAKV